MRRVTRRAALTHSLATVSAVRAVGLIPTPLRVSFGRTPDPVPPIQDPRIKELALRALQAAREAGASYADIRLTHTRNRGTAQDEEYVHAGVRALIQGYWGFAAGALWQPEAMVRLGREAAHQAKVNSLGKPREVELPPVRAIADGHWETPVKRDGFSVHPQEVRDFVGELKEQIWNEIRGTSRFGNSTGYISIVVGFLSQAKAFASTEGSYCTQRLHWINDGASCTVYPGAGGFGTGIGSYNGSADEVLGWFAGAGWEHFTEAPIIETIRRTMAESRELAKLPVKDVDIGRHDVVFDALSVSQLVSRTIGAATELDRALGYEANASGTSYLNAPDTMLGQFDFGSKLLTVTANRTETGGVATTKWDDEGVDTGEVTLIDKGVLQNYQTSREGAGWLKETSTRLNRPFQSQGCLFAPTAGEAPLIHSGNLVLQPGAGSATQRELEAQLGTGIAVVGLNPRMDFQCLNGAQYGLTCYEIKGGKRVARIQRAGMLFRAPELWKNIIAIGGAPSVRRWGLGIDQDLQKGEPVQYGYRSVTAVPITVKQVTFINAVQR